MVGWSDRWGWMGGGGKKYLSNQVGNGINGWENWGKIWILYFRYAKGFYCFMLLTIGKGSGSGGSAVFGVGFGDGLFRVWVVRWYDMIQWDVNDTTIHDIRYKIYYTITDIYIYVLYTLYLLLRYFIDLVFYWTCDYIYKEREGFMGLLWQDYEDCFDFCGGNLLDTDSDKLISLLEISNANVWLKMRLKIGIQ